MNGSRAQIRPFRWPDVEVFTRVFNEVNGIVDTEKAYDVEYMQQFLSQPSCKPEDHCFLAESEGVLVGFFLVAPELPIGRAVASGGVLESHRNLGTGRKLLRTAVEHAHALGASRIHIQAPTDGVAARRVLDSEGFRVVKDYWEMRRRAGAPPPLELPEGFSLRSFRPGRDEQALTELQNAAFGQQWGFCPNTVEEISARVRLKRSAPEGIIFVLDGSRPSAYNWTMSVANESGSTGWIAMTGVHPDYRGRGLGRAVVGAGLEYLEGNGVARVELEVDAENTPARDIYLGLGFRKVSQTVWYEKGLES